ncbi:hypothetical protein P3T73_00760 [Kiritimatiellota bacterium B12222]|nr:hypothetical protein P3T73_00760 [Kiritimatiellota bacterium B12222]
MNTRKPTFYFLLSLLMLLGGCATTEKRIKNNAEIFATYSPEEQALIRESKVGLGFSQKMVEIALGPPSYIYLQQSEESDQLIWSYTEDRPYHNQIAPIYNDTINGINIVNTQEIEYMRVEFTDNRVTHIRAMQ